MSITADEWILIAFVVLAIVPMVISKFYTFEWHPEAKAAAKANLVLVPCDCGAEEQCPQGRTVMQSRCRIWKQEKPPC